METRGREPPELRITGNAFKNRLVPSVDCRRMEEEADTAVEVGLEETPEV